MAAEDQRPTAGDERLALRGNRVPNEPLRTEEECEVVVRPVVTEDMLVAEHCGVEPEVGVAGVVRRDPEVLPADEEALAAFPAQVDPVATTEVVAGRRLRIRLRNRIRRAHAREERPVDPEGLRDVPLDRDLCREEEERLLSPADPGEPEPDAALDRSELQTSGSWRRTTLECGDPPLDLVKATTRAVDLVEARVVTDHRLLERLDVLVHAALNAAVEVPEHRYAPIVELRVVHGRRAVDVEVSHATPHQLVLDRVAPAVGEVGVLQLMLRTKLLNIRRADEAYGEAGPLPGCLRDLV